MKVRNCGNRDIWLTLRHESKPFYLKRQNTMGVTLLISTYNRPDALGLSLYSLSLQTMMPDEVVIADDGSTTETADVIRRFASILPVPVKHVWQEDDGFRKSLILNKAVKEASGDYIIQIDGDIVMERHFIEDHAAAMERGRFIRGGRVMLGEEETRKCLSLFMHGGRLDIDRISGDRNRMNALRNRLLSRMMSGVGSVTDVKGCNMAYWKADFVRVNGYNNDFQGWGHEDIEFAIRLHNAGVKLKRLKFAGIAYHLHHAYFSRHNESRNFEMASKMLALQTAFAENGYKQV